MGISGNADFSFSNNRIKIFPECVWSICCSEGATLVLCTWSSFSLFKTMDNVAEYIFQFLNGLKQKCLSFKQCFFLSEMSICSFRFFFPMSSIELKKMSKMDRWKSLNLCITEKSLIPLAAILILLANNVKARHQLSKSSKIHHSICQKILVHQVCKAGVQALVVKYMKRCSFMNPVHLHHVCSVCLKWNAKPGMFHK